MKRCNVRMEVTVVLLGVCLTGIAAAAEGGALRERARQIMAEKRATAKDHIEQTRKRIRERIQEHRDVRQQKVDEGRHKGWTRVIDKRQGFQAKRIEHGIRKGYLTNEELSTLQNQQQAIANLETSALADGTLTKAEFAEIRTALNEASRCIWAEKHDTEGNPMPVYRLGKNVFAQDDLTAKLADENLSPEEAKRILADFRRMMEVKRKLSSEDLSEAERAALQAEYNELLNRYFVVREGESAAAQW